MLLSLVHHLFNCTLSKSCFFISIPFKCYLFLDSDFLRVLGADRTFDRNSEDFIQVFHFWFFTKVEMKWNETVKLTWNSTGTSTYSCRCCVWLWRMSRGTKACSNSDEQRWKISECLLDRPQRIESSLVQFVAIR
jgi:hypothetical protein